MVIMKSPLYSLNMVSYHNIYIAEVFGKFCSVRITCKTGDHTQANPLEYTRRKNTVRVAELLRTTTYEVNASKQIEYCTSQIFCDQKISQIASKKGRQKYLRQKYSRRRLDTLRNTVTWLLCFCGWSDLWRSMNPSQYYTPSRVYSASLVDTWQYSANVLQQRVSL